ncbi:MAG: hypothetical protein WKF87_10570 [Chryseolinea sp.]
MKKLIALFLVFLVLFNALGFYGLLVGIQYHKSQQLVQRLDTNQYLEEETVTIRLPMSIPYFNDADSYRRVDGQIEHNGEFFRLVKEKLVKDTLYIVCIKDNDTKKIRQALADHVKTFTDKPVNAKHNGKLQISIIKDFLPSSIAIASASTGWTSEVTATQLTHLFNSITPAFIGPPPRC